jgi:hypothetical protein
LWSIELKQWNLGVCKDLEEEAIWEAKSFYFSESFRNIH